MQQHDDKSTTSGEINFGTCAKYDVCYKSLRAMQRLLEKLISNPSSASYNS